MAELYRARISAVLAADTKFDVRSGCFTFLYSHLYKLSYANLVKLCERHVLLQEEYAALPPDSGRTRGDGGIHAGRHTPPQADEMCIRDRYQPVKA